MSITIAVVGLLSPELPTSSSLNQHIQVPQLIQMVGFAEHESSARHSTK